MPMPSAADKGAPGIDGQDFAEIEAYGVERWLTELAPRGRPVAAIDLIGPAIAWRARTQNLVMPAVCQWLPLQLGLV